MQIRKGLYPLLLGLALISCSPAKPDYTSPQTVATQTYIMQTEQGGKRPEQKADFSQIKSELDAYVVVGERLSELGDHGFAGYIFGSAMKYFPDDREFKQLKSRAVTEYEKAANDMEKRRYLSKQRFQDVDKLIEDVMESDNSYVHAVKESIRDYTRPIKGPRTALTNYRFDPEKFGDCNSIEASASLYAGAFGLSSLKGKDEHKEIDVTKETILYARKTLQTIEDSLNCTKRSGSKKILFD